MLRQLLIAALLLACLAPIAHADGSSEDGSDAQAEPSPAPGNGTDSGQADPQSSPGTAAPSPFVVLVLQIMNGPNPLPKIPELICYNTSPNPPGIPSWGPGGINGLPTEYKQPWLNTGSNPCPNSQ